MYFGSIKRKANEFIILLFLASLIPFTYLSVLSLRAISLALFAFVFLALQNSLRHYWALVVRKDLFVMILVLGYCFCLSHYEYDYFLSLVFFCFFLYWPYLLRSSDNSLSFSRKLKGIYVYGALFSSLGLMIQIVLDQFYEIELGYQKVFGGPRYAYGFIWRDFSFLSLYLVSAVPLSFSIVRKKVAYLFSFILFFASCLTSARTGPFSLIMFTGIYFAVLAFRLKWDFLALKTLALKFCVLNLCYWLVMRVSKVFVARKVTFSGSGRVKDFDDFNNYFFIWSKELFFGNGFSRLKYRNEVGTIPHHFLLDFVSMGGIVFLFLILIWGGLFSLSIKRPCEKILGSILISLIGFNFIPSFFSAYFCAFIFSLLIVDTKVYSNE